MSGLRLQGVWVEAPGCLVWGFRVFGLRLQGVWFEAAGCMV